MERELRLANICNIIKTKSLIIFIPYVLFFYVLCLSLPDQCVCSPIAHPSRNGEFWGIGSPPCLRKFRFESVALHPSQERNCYVSTEISLHATVLSNQRPRKYHRIGVTLNLFIFMFYVSCNKNKLFIIGYFLIIIIEDLYLNHSNLLVFWTLNGVYVVSLTKFMDYSKLILLHEIGISVTTAQISNYHESRTYSFDVLKFQY